MLRRKTRGEIGSSVGVAVGMLVGVSVGEEVGVETLRSVETGAAGASSVVGIGGDVDSGAGAGKMPQPVRMTIAIHIDRVRSVACDILV
jgi:hypothetical protein